MATETKELRGYFNDSPEDRELRIADGVLENFVVVDEADFRPKAVKREVPTGITVSPRTLAKFRDFADRRDLRYRDINEHLRHARAEQVTNELRHAFSDTFGIKTDARVRILTADAGPHITLCFIEADGVVVEMVSWRGLRQLRKRAMHRAQVQLAGVPEAVRIHDISKKVHRVKIQGGLMRQESQPRDRWK
jgi:hypothetical protein